MQDSFSLVVDVVAQQALKKDGSELKGMGKKGAWSMATVILENGIKMNVFNPVKVGDTVYDLTQNDYKQWNGKVKAAGSSQFPSTPGAAQSVPDMGQPTNAQIMETFRKLRTYLDERFEKIENMVAALELDNETKDFVDVQGQKPQGDTVVSPEEMDAILESGEQIDLESIPF